VSPNNRIDITGMTDQQWRGYVTGAVDDIRGDVSEIKEKMCKSDELEKKLRTKVAAVGGTVALLVSVVITFLGGFIKHLLGAK